MTFEVIESSVEDGRPIELYSFALANRQFLFNTGPSRKMTADGRIWEPAPLSNDGVRQTGESTSDALTITVPTNIAPAQMLMLSPPSEPLMVTIYQMHAGDNVPIAIYVGEVAQVNFPQPGKCVMTCETVSASLRREGLRLAWQRSCTHVLFDPATCKVDKSLYALGGVFVSEVNGMDVTVTIVGTTPDDTYTGGYIEWPHPVKGLERIAIEKHVGFVLTMFGPTTEITPGLLLTVYPGCELTPEACQLRYDNYDNYGGIPALPGKSPFEGDPIF